MNNSIYFEVALPSEDHRFSQLEKKQSVGQRMTNKHRIWTQNVFVSTVQMMKVFVLFSVKAVF